MGEMKEGAKNEGEKKDDGNGAVALPVVLKMDMHCGGCAKKIRRAVRKFDGIEDVMVDIASQKLMVTGKVDPAMIKEILERKTNKKVEIVSPPPKKDGGGGGDKKPEEKPEKKAEEKKTEDKKAEDKKPKEMMVGFKIRTHCDGCIKKMKRIISKIEGVSGVSINGDKDLVAVTGTVDPKELAAFLREKLKRSVEVLPPPAKKDDGGSDKKEKEGGGSKEAGGGGGGDKKEKEAAAGGGEKKDGVEKKDKGVSKNEDGGGNEAPKMELSRMEYPGFSPQPPMYWSEGPSYAQSYAHNYAHNYAHPQSYSHSYAHNYAVEPYNQHAGYANQGYPNHYVHEGYGVPMDHQLHPMDPRFNPPQMFSDENPNACSVM